jgi:predicted HTH domain antitoxin
MSYGKARELTGLSKGELGLLPGQRNIPRQYEASDLQDNLTYAGRQ